VRFRAPLNWISKWILEQKTSNILLKKEAFDSVTRKEVPSWTITKHAPEEIKPVENNTINDLKK
jgi:hypothetical protein